MSGLFRRARALAANPAALAMMIGATKFKSQANAKTVAEQGQQRKDNAKVTLDLANGTLNAKDMPIEDMHKQIAGAAAGPFQELSQTITQLGDQVDQDQIDAATNHWEGVLPKISDAWKNKGKKSAMERALALNKLGETATAMTRAQTMARQQKQDATKQNNAIYSEIKKSDLNSLTPEDVAARAGVDPSDLTDQHLATMKQRRDQLTLEKAKSGSDSVNKRISTLKTDDVAGYTDFRAWLTDQQAETGDFSDSQKSRAESRFTGLKKQYEDEQQQKQARDERANNADVRSADAAARAAVNQTRSEDKDAARAHSNAISDIAKQIQENNKTIMSNSRSFSSTSDPEKRDTLQKQNGGLVEENKKLRGNLDTLLGKKKVLSADEALKALP